MRSRRGRRCAPGGPRAGRGDGGGSRPKGSTRGGASTLEPMLRLREVYSMEVTGEAREGDVPATLSPPAPQAVFTTPFSTEFAPAAGGVVGQR